jgi:hypothetical protein
VLQSIITAAEKYSSYATVEYNRQSMLREVQEASDEDSDSLAWFTNTIAYKSWQRGNTPGIYYPITPDSASSGHDIIAAALSYHLRARFASKVEPFCHIFYFKPSRNESVTYPVLDNREMCRSLTSQALLTFDCITNKLLFMKMSHGTVLEKLTLLLTTDQTLSIGDLTNVLNLVIDNIPNSTASIDTRPSVILVIDRIGQDDDEFPYFMVSKFRRLLKDRKAKLVVSTFGSDPDLGISFLGGKIDEDTECNGKHPRFIWLANAKSVCGSKIA